MSPNEENEAKQRGKVSLERLSNPEQLNALLIVVTYKAWITLLCLLGLALAVILWSIFGSIPITLEGRGIVMNPQGLMYNIPAKLGGTVRQINVKAGDLIEKGALIAEIYDFNEELKLNNALTRLNKLNAELEKIKAEIDKDAPKGAALELLKGKLQDKQLEIEQVEKIRDLIKTNSHYYNVYSPYPGHVLEVLSSVGDRVAIGSPLAWMEYISSEKTPHYFYGYFPVEQGKRIAVGMKVNIELSTVDSQEYGYLSGTVKAVSDYAVSKESIIKMVHSKELADYLAWGTHAVVEVLIDVKRKPGVLPESHEEYEWSSGKTPPLAVTSGTVCKIQAIVERVRPIYYILPLSSFKES